MKLIKLPFKIIALPVIAVIYIACLLGKALNHISCYIIGPIMLFAGIVIVVMLCKQEWSSMMVWGLVELACFIAVFGTTVLICWVEDLNGLLVKFVRS